MSEITIKRPSGTKNWGSVFDNQGQTPTGPLAQVNEVQFGIKSQCSIYQNTAYPVMRTPNENHQYLRRAREKNVAAWISSQGGDHPDSRAANQLKLEKMARKGFDAFINHVTHDLKHAQRHGRDVVDIEVPKMLDSFRRYRAQGGFEHDHTRNLAAWLQFLVQKHPGQDTHTTLTRAIIQGLKDTGYKDLKLEKRYFKQNITVPQEPSPLSIFKKKPQAPRTATISIPNEVICVKTQLNNQPHLDNLNPKTQAAIRHRIPSWIGSIFEG